MIKTSAITTERKVYKFYCDKCNKFISESYEYDDGYYNAPEEIILSCYIFNNWYELNKGMYCSKCEKEVKEKIINGLENIGFRKAKK